MPGLALMVNDERELLLSYLAQQRQGIRNAAYGLTDDQCRLVPTAGALSLGGLIKHATAVERHWAGIILQRVRQASLEERMAEHADIFCFRPDETLAGALAAYAEAARETDGVIAGITDLGQAVPVPKGVPWFPADLEAWSVRWVLIHMIEETARHAGHADIIRESIDGATMYELMAAAEGWPADGFVKPWRPVGASARV